MSRFRKNGVAKIWSSLIIIAGIIFLSVYAYGKLNSNGQTIDTSVHSSALPSSYITSSPKPQTILIKVPFTSQAPDGNWNDEREQNGCEEASALMAMAWVNGTALNTTTSLQQILSIADYEQNTYGSYYDTNAQDTVKRIFNDYFHYSNVKAVNDPSAQDIINELNKGNVVLTPMNGQKLNNPYYVQPGPLEHMIVVVGYDPKTNEFITNDPGTRHGQSLRYSASLYMNAISNYPTGHHLPIIGAPKAMIVVSK